MGTFYILGCSASYPPSCLGEPQCVGQSSASQQGDSSRPDILPSRLRVLGHQHTASAWPRGLASGLRATVRQGQSGFFRVESHVEMAGVLSTCPRHISLLPSLHWSFIPARFSSLSVDSGSVPSFSHQIPFPHKIVIADFCCL